jgi:hypothetical protein
MKPGDGATLSQVVSYMQQHYNMPSLPINSRLRGYLGTWSDYHEFTAGIEGILQDPGYPTHLSVVTVYIMQNMGIHDFDEEVSIFFLKTVNQRNAFFGFVGSGGKLGQGNVTIESCPSPDNDFHLLPGWNSHMTPGNDTWHWQNNLSDGDWAHSDYWDCIFLAHLNGIPEPPPKRRAPHPRTGH